MARIVFVTGTDTGVGKTLVVASLLYHLRQRDVSALAMKPFCSGSRADVQLLQRLQRGALTDKEVNPFYFREPVAPLVAARKARQEITMEQVLESVRAIDCRCQRLIIEGAGGLLAPLGTDFTALDLIAALDCDVCVVAGNRLGVINHTLLTVETLQREGSRAIKVVLTKSRPYSDPSTRTNAEVTSELLTGIPVLSLPFLGRSASTVASIKRNHPKTAAVWQNLLG